VGLDGGLVFGCRFLAMVRHYKIVEWLYELLVSSSVGKVLVEKFASFDLYRNRCVRMDMRNPLLALVQYERNSNCV
jgi:hypothetical protein